MTLAESVGAEGAVSKTVKSKDKPIKYFLAAQHESTDNQNMLVYHCLSSLVDGPNLTKTKNVEKLNHEQQKVTCG